VPGAIFIGLNAIVTSILVCKKSLSMRQLRRIEVAFFGLAVLLFGWEQFRYFHIEGFLGRYAQRELQETITAARHGSLTWFALVVGYGMFVPNTGRRCALVAGGIALTALAISLACALLDRTLGLPRMSSFIVETATWLTVAVAFAIYGSHKITTLGLKALAAGRVGPYQLQRRLGAGGMGEVYRAQHHLLKRPCAIKLIRP